MYTTWATAIILNNDPYPNMTLPIQATSLEAGFGAASGPNAAVSFDANCVNEREFQLAKIREIREISVKGFWFAFKIKPNTSRRKVMQGICGDAR
jgi:hypothetical protein